MGYARGVGYFVGILVIILGLIFRMQSASTSGTITGIITIIVGIIIIWIVRKIGKTQKKIKENISGYDAREEQRIKDEIKRLEEKKQLDKDNGEIE
jgi:flagellar motor component MotA